MNMPAPATPTTRFGHHRVDDRGPRSDHRRRRWSVSSPSTSRSMSQQVEAARQAAESAKAEMRTRVQRADRHRCSNAWTRSQQNTDAYQKALQTALEDRLADFAQHQHRRLAEVENRILEMPAGIERRTRRPRRARQPPRPDRRAERRGPRPHRRTAQGHTPLRRAGVGPGAARERHHHRARPADGRGQPGPRHRGRGATRVRAHHARGRRPRRAASAHRARGDDGPAHRLHRAQGHRPHARHGGPDQRVQRHQDRPPRGDGRPHRRRLRRRDRRPVAAHARAREPPLRVQRPPARRSPSR